MPYYLVRPEVPGQLGEKTVLDRSGDSPRVTHLEYIFDGWLGDELVTSFPAFAATKTLADQLVAAGLTGFQLRDMEMGRSEEFDEFYPDRELPDFVELVITGRAGVDDFGINADRELVISQRALDPINTTGPVDMEVEPLQP